MTLPRFKQSALNAFGRAHREDIAEWAAEGTIIDHFFCFIQGNRTWMKHYLDTVAREGNLRKVNNQIAQHIRRRFNLRSLKRRINNPQSILIQGYTILTIKHA